MSECSDKVWIDETGCVITDSMDVRDDYDTAYIRADLVPQWLPIESAPDDLTKADLLVDGLRYNDAVNIEGFWQEEDFYEGFTPLPNPTHYMIPPVPPKI